MDFLLSAVAGLFLIGFLVVIHEFGHYVAARVFGVGVPVFSVGMGPRIAGVRFGDTDWRLSALPVGGYVQLAGADPFGEEDADSDIPPDQDFMRKPVWQRLIIMAAGPAVNLALPFFIFTVLLMLGRPDVAAVVGSVLPGTPAAEAGLAAGDTLLRVNGSDVVVWPDVEAVLAASDADAPLALDVRGADGVERVVEVAAAALPRTPAGEADLNGFGLTVTRAGGVYRMPVRLSSRIGLATPDSPAGRAGLRTGDGIVAVDGAEVLDFEGLLGALHGERHEVTWVRAQQRDNGSQERVEGTAVLEAALDAPLADPANSPLANRWGLLPAMLFVNEVGEGTPAAAAGIEPGDRFVSANGAVVLSFDHFIDLVGATVQGGGAPGPLELSLVRDGVLRTLTLTPERKVVDGEAHARPIIGVASFAETFRGVGVASKRYGPIEAAVRGSGEAWGAVERTGALLANIFTGHASASSNLGGPVAIFDAAAQAASLGFFAYAGMIAMVSVSLGVANLLPIPALDGGQILFYTVELVRGEPLSLEVRERFQMVGVMALMLLMLLVTVKDIGRVVGL